MTKSEIGRTVCRVLALFFVICAVLEMTYFPQCLNSLMHYWNGANAARDADYWKRYYVLETASLTLRTFANFLLGLIFWNPGRRLLRLLGLEEVSIDASQALKSPAK